MNMRPYPATQEKYKKGNPIIRKERKIERKIKDRVEKILPFRMKENKILKEGNLVKRKKDG